VTNSTTDVENVIREYLTMVEKVPETFDGDVKLFADGVGLDSLETAELSAILEDHFGNDPYSAGDTPETVGEILRFYSVQGAEAS